MDLGTKKNRNQGNKQISIAGSHWTARLGFSKSCCPIKQTENWKESNKNDWISGSISAIMLPSHCSA